MTRPRMIDWRPDRDLDSLLDALTEELLAAPDRDFVSVGPPSDVPDTVRRIIAAAESDICRPHGAASPGSVLRAFISRDS